MLEDYVIFTGIAKFWIRLIWQFVQCFIRIVMSVFIPGQKYLSLINLFVARIPMNIVKYSLNAIPMEYKDDIKRKVHTKLCIWRGYMDFF